ncbi:MAG: alpha/beta fold hydrolase [Phenylobacterium sp.]|uniref:alpha/beta fold hydrolase n=1 Tax=Phenylobacterium sp. TaxID=1871053 RepID=UPI0027360A4C|nr:alpha/beta fold hydrolase [Phenylobacterium sp.]MDP3745892.1 alpha/beta fold hydrolase [Phenylobacterium sp.]
MGPRAILVLLGLVGLIATPRAVAAPFSPRFEEAVCAAPELVGVARCGTVAVPERWDTGAGRVALKVVILPARKPRPGAPALFDLEGGPGLPSTKNAGFYLTEGARYWESRDVILFDQRGTGGSGGLQCPALQAAEAALRPMYPSKEVEACREALSARADLTRYTTDAAARDIEAVRAALGHETIDINALSYGTTLALRYMAREPSRVHAAVLTGPAPPQAMPPRHHATAAATALKLLIGDCRADRACAAAFPDIAGDLRRGRARLAQAGGDPTPEVFMEKVRSLMYAPSSARQLPDLVHRAAGGDFSWMRHSAAAAGAPGFAEGLYLSVTCAESLALMPYEAAAAAARATPFGDYRLRRQREACRAWPTARVRLGGLGPSRAPVLLISGRLDPVTPADWAADLARSRPNTRQLTIHEGGHVVDGLSALDTCFDPLVVKFLETGDLEAIDARCIADMRAPAFQLVAPAKGG